MIRFRYYTSGSLFGIQYWFDTAGEQLPYHRHSAQLAHNTICLHGSVQLKVGEDMTVVHAGQIVDFDGAKPHSMTAMVPGTSIFNLLLNGKPAGMPLPEEMEGTIP